MILIATASGIGRVGETGGLTATALIVIAAFAVLVIFGILWGIKQKRARLAGEEAGQDRADALGEHPRIVAPLPPAPPPLVDSTPPELMPTPVAKPKPAANAKPVAQPSTTYRLIDVKGLGPKAVPLLEQQGVVDLATLAGLSDERAAEIDRQLGNLSGRMTRDRWVEQAKLLVAGEVAEFEQTYGKL